MEIERKFLSAIDFDVTEYPFKTIMQAYICTDPVLRLRKSESEYILTFKGRGILKKIEEEIALNENQFVKLWTKIDTNIIQKKRYYVPLNDSLVAEVDIYEGTLAPLVTIEVEFETEEEALAYEPPAWFGREVTYDRAYSNASLSSHGLPESE